MSSSDLRHVLHASELDDSVWRSVLDSAVSYKENDTRTNSADGKTIGLLFFNPSLRTRTSMEVAAAHLGADSTTLTPGEGTWNLAWEDGAVMDGDAAEHVREAIGVLSRYHDALGVRVFASGTDYEADKSDELIRRVAEVATVPVINLESAWAHPCQAVSDASLLTDRFDGDPSGKDFVLTWTYHPKALPMAVPNSTVKMAARCGMNVTVARPESHALDDGVMEAAQSLADPHGATVSATDDLDAAVKDADVVYAKSWGGPLVYTDPEKEAEIRTSSRDWRVTADRMARTTDGAFMHCLPVRRNVVVDDAVMDGSHAVHLDQAEYRLHAQKALLDYVWDLG
ncbi:acetylornithine carbamoyltransferase [Salinibacter sp. 10B]|uniref:N-acetylornithine carbamoyltransferase n=1 Tax=Salinibacter sp. 10B TaxID=1923971 RepID=UPI000CF42F22|nr:N-acetylornithine carbamoyltransferase [Salinibacter sp. 10B]PQJ34108.1 acetylornithine carbamoyltransferase [Salinibacter sp. 10B]